MRYLDDRYLNDTTFKILVDNFYSLFLTAKYTPSEIREAAMFAQIRYEMLNPRPTMFSPELVKEIKFRMEPNEKEIS